MQLGSIAELVSAFAALGALAAATVAAWAARGTLRGQRSELSLLREQHNRRIEKDDRAASSKVAVWARTDRGEKAVLRYINASGVPVYALTVWAVIPGHRFDVFYTVIGPTATSRTLRRGSEELQGLVVEKCPDVDWVWLLRNEKIVASATFRDLNGVWWHRALSGVLTEHSDAHGAKTAAEVDTQQWIAQNEPH